MVTIPPDTTTSSNQPPRAPNPPYPLSPSEQARLPVPLSNNPLHPQKTALSEHRESDSEDDWDKDDDDEDWEITNKPDVPDPLKTAQSKDKAALPSSLRAGPPPGAVIKKKSTDNVEAIASQVSLPLSHTGNSIHNSQISLPQQVTPPHLQANPFIQKQNTGEQIFGVTSSPRPHQPVQVTYDDGANGPVELPATHTPLDGRFRFNPTSPFDAQPPLIPVDTESPSTFGPRHESNASSQWEPGADISSIDALSSRAHRLPSDAIATPTKTWDEQKDWERQQRERRELEAAAAVERAQRQDQMRQAEEEYHRGEAAHRASGIQEEQAPATPPRPAVITSGNRSAQRNLPEHYSIKQIRWYDARSNKLRTSPILVQNANGPCPLLALVNALVLSTPAHESSGLAETLKTREQVSLGLLIESVFDELTSGRRGDSGQEIPDVMELYDFLRALHTGMNVNPRFTFVPDRASREIHPLMRPTTAAGAFEETKEMKLYQTFNIPLVHGWLPPRDSPTYMAFTRSANYFEEAQNIQFHEEELDHKLNSTGLTPQEQELFEDLTTIKSFLQNWPTQLTDYGLKTLHENIQPGSFSILFRNDHFTMIYKEPRANQLMTLVTDAGYASHDEIIWENLVDINGKDSELFSGDFRPVSHAASSGIAGNRGSSLGNSQPMNSMLDVGDSGGEWSTVPSRSSRGRQSQPNHLDSQLEHLSVADPSERSRAEQEDHDLALALQLQEEEEARARRENEARQRDAVFEGQGRVQGAGGNRINVPVTGPPPPRPQRVEQQRPPAQPPRPRVDPEAGTAEPPPPTYEQAAPQPAWVPPVNHPASPNAPVPAPGSGRGRGGMGMSRPMGGMGRARPQQPVGMREDRDKCVLM
ncbi:hypothetical protein BT63DRAFT_50625 [Microthyrium microscopicum]|uniref:MINDY deubiquitinase domain-containing protein n=1 Tax=Microthyrium microscopicum TaxID=703497 RepID=A0A6A6U3W7_9PEZI|nr:hypothetical protein BT63DRAFT_50625 [Microthyrium microscopicum]